MKKGRTEKSLSQQYNEPMVNEILAINYEGNEIVSEVNILSICCLNTF